MDRKPAIVTPLIEHNNRIYRKIYNLEKEIQFLYKLDRSEATPGTHFWLGMQIGLRSKWQMKLRGQLRWY